MKLRELTEMLAPSILARARKRWPGQVCAIYALGLSDPLGHVIAVALHTLGLGPNPHRHAESGAPATFLAGAVPLLDLLNVLRDLAEADRWFESMDEPPIAKGAAELHATLERAADSEAPLMLYVHRDHRHVFPVKAEVAIAPRTMFGATTVVGRA